MNTVESPSGAKKPGGFALWAARLQMAHGRKLVIALPYLWLILLFMLPFLIVFKISLAEMARAIAPDVAWSACCHKPEGASSSPTSSASAPDFGKAALAKAMSSMGELRARGGWRGSEGQAVATVAAPPGFAMSHPRAITGQ